MPFYEIIHHTKLTHKQRETLAEGITTLHSKTFSAPSHFVNIKFSSAHNASILAPSSPAVPEYFIAGQARTHPNIIFAHVRGGASRNNDVFKRLAEDIEKIWDDAVGLPLYKPSGHPAETHPPQAEGGEEEKWKQAQGAPQPEINWNDERRLQAVFIVPGMIARESGFSIPDVSETRD
jgi:phenylpyruvate tautomerase PptA (4-oxalocrotonate tautomerase family)